jgi:hypothetical protein
MNATFSFVQQVEVGVCIAVKLDTTGFVFHLFLGSDTRFLGEAIGSIAATV